jgi:hypothetical protein
MWLAIDRTMEGEAPEALRSIGPALLAAGLQAFCGTRFALIWGWPVVV